MIVAWPAGEQLRGTNEQTYDLWVFYLSVPKAAFVEDLKTLKQRHTTPVRKAQRGQIQGKQEGMRASLVCARVEELTCDGVSVKICGFWFGTSEQHVR